ncbi:hypothetical protein SAMD00019534_090920 [Acytostelium subglobosum LB1]|uniref:hypothetical protein n=1 Tax=Acytostelium subglobosum LB1 TaxID=1410327 RepID=UPI000644B7A5|nr:hypothetical protein SAMD00019534_090920 [Acytostelium subglobosum LB1]GAM25917.1 hypothetical protein SAMD00019534_090920 [Acytostelium subglobosum LB1]|eukprot:XP_012750960.1 hypothetical protein SAMD00019534_090920 [Acytostelium subglobosum LB1]
MVLHKHFGLLRDRIKRNLHVHFTFSTVQSICQSPDIDQHTFTMLYNRYQRFFTCKSALLDAVTCGNLPIVQTLLHQTHPIVFERTDDLLVRATQGGHIKVLKYLLDTGKFNNEVLWKRHPNAVMEALHNSSTSAAIRFLMDPHNFPQDLIDLVKSNVNLYAKACIRTGDQQLIDQLLSLDVIKQITFTCDFMLPNNFQPIHQLAHFERLFQGTNDGGALDRRAEKELTSSRQTTQSILTSTTDTYAHSGIGDDQRLVFIKLAEVVSWDANDDLASYLAHQYVVTGDFVLFPYLFSKAIHVKTMINLIVLHGNVVQAKVVLGYLDNVIMPAQLGTILREEQFGELYDSFVQADNMSNSFEIIKYLNNNQVVVKEVAKLSSDLFPGTMEMLKFLLSDANKIFPMDKLQNMLVVLAIDQLEYVLKTKPSVFLAPGSHSLVHIAMNASFFARLDTLDAILDHIQPERHLESTLHCALANGGRHMGVIKLLVERQHITLNSISCQIGQLGDVELLEYALVHCVDNSLDAFLSSTINTAIFRHQVDLIQHIYARHKDKVQTYHHKQAVEHGSLELMEFIFAVDPLSNTDRLETFIRCAISDGNTEILDWLLKCEDNVPRRSQILQSLVPQHTTSLVNKSDIFTLQHLVNIGATLDMKVASKLKAYKESEAIQYLFAQYKKQTSQAESKAKQKSKQQQSKKTKRDDNNTDDTTTTQPIKRKRK